MSGLNKNQRARDIVGWYTLAATAKGAVPVPATSMAIVANNAAMLTHISAVMGQRVQITDVVMSLGVMCNVNMIGRAIFIEGAKALSWGTGSWWALVGLSVLGAGTAGLQTYIEGLIAIEICANGGEPIDKSVAARLIENARQTYDGFVLEMKRKKVAAPV